MQFILASESARRVDLLRGVGYYFEAVRSGFPEVTRDDPRRTVQENALGKARTVAGKYPAQVVLGSDTVVYLPTEKVTYGQAATPGQSRQMISTLTGRVHEVHSGVAVVRGDEVSVRHSVTEVRIRTLSEADLDAYGALAEGVGKAGGYAIQGKAALFVEWVGGDYSNVVGLPLALTCRMLSDFGVGWYPGNSDD